jgi:hypothetical protein
MLLSKQISDAAGRAALMSMDDYPTHLVREQLRSLARTLDLLSDEARDQEAAASPSEGALQRYFRRAFALRGAVRS